MILFIDTNILLDVILFREPFVENSSKIWTLCEKNIVNGFISSISFNNIHYLVNRIESRQKADRAITLLLDTFNSLPPDNIIIRKAHDAFFPDFEDAIQFFSALKINANFIITRNVKDFPHDDIPVLTPEEFLKLGLDI